jgi:glc operon protein GlcG
MRQPGWMLIAAAWVLLCGSALADAPLASIDQTLAESMAQQCFLRSRANGWPPVTIAVVDAGGALVLLRRQDGASSVTAEAALLKARTATRVGAPTEALVAMSQDSPARDLMMLLQLTDDPGGIPVKVGGRIIGAVGVSGGSATQDVGCATLSVAVTAERK